MTEPRDQAVQALYEAEQRGAPPESEGLSAKAARLVKGVEQHRESIDAQIERLSERWRLRRMPPVDRVILRLGAYELLHTEMPVGVVLNEAVRLAKTYSTERSGAFVNGLLGRLAGEL